ncbi:hypothetical protein M9Y10_033410 [Tritrichomonas musculus]|uniref:DH domain-containing protein n=1 Tax=Tritrichomonas musculus TaxID=1915356 RepID=A0ABR2KCT5_9EUKA
MKTTHQGAFTNFLNAVIWMMMTFFSIVKAIVFFIVHLFFYNSVPLESEIPKDFHSNNTKHKPIDYDNNANASDNKKIKSKAEIELNDSNHENKEEEEKNTEIQNSTDEISNDEEKEREILKKKLQEEDEEEEKRESQKENRELEPNQKSLQPHQSESKTVSKEENLQQKNSQKNEENNNFEESETLTVNEETEMNKIATNQKEENEEMNINSNNSSSENSVTERKLSQQSEDTPTNEEQNEIPPELTEKRKMAIQKLIVSEDTYCQYLSVLTEVFRAKLNNIIDKETSDLLFGHVQPLIDLSSKFIDLYKSELNKGPEKAEIWKCYTNIHHAVETYEPYISHYKKALSTYKKMQLINLKFRFVVKKIEASNPNYKYTSIAVMPIEQLSRIPVLLNEILKVTPDWHPDYQNLPNAILEIRESFQKTAKQYKISEYSSKLQNLEDQIIDCPPLSSPDRTYIGSFKLIDWKKLYVFNDILLLVRGKRLKKLIKMDNIKFIWIDSNTGTVHISTKSKKDIKFRGGVKGNTIYSILRNQLNKSSCGLPPNITERQKPYLYRRSDLVRAPPPPSSTLFSSAHNSTVNTETDSNSFMPSFYSMNSSNSTSTNTNTSSNTNDSSNTSHVSTFMDSKDNNLIDDDDLDDTDDDEDDVEETAEFGNISEITGNIEESDSKGISKEEEESKSNTQVSDDENKLNEEMLNKRKMTIESMIKAEKQYQKNLHNLINLYKPKFSKSIVNEKTEQTLFGNISPLIIISEQCSNTLSDELEKGADKAQVWKCFPVTSESIRFYKDYMSNYTNMLFHYNNFILSDKKIKKFVKKIAAEDPDNRFTILSTTPFTRVPILIEQLQAICKVTPEWHPDSENLPDIISDFANISDKLIEKSIEADKLERIIEIETSIIDCPSLFSSNRNFLKSFSLDDKSSIYVMNDIIVFARPTRKIKYCLSFSDIKKISYKDKNVALSMNDGKTHLIRSNDQTQAIFDFLKSQKEKQDISV